MADVKSNSKDTHLRLPGFIRLIGREMRILTANPFLLLLVIVAPLVYPFLYNTVYVKKMERDAPVAVVDNDRSEASRELIRDIDASELLAVRVVLPDLSSASDRLADMEDVATVIIPAGYEGNLKKGKLNRIGVSISNYRFLVAGDVSRAIGDILASRAKVVAENSLQKAGYGGEQAELQAAPVNPLVVNSFNSTESYGDFIIVGLFAIILQQTLLMGIAASTTMERQKKTISELFTIAGNSISSVILGKCLFYIVLYMAYALLYCTVYYRIYSIPFNGSLTELMSLFLLHFCSMAVWSFFIASFFKNTVMALGTFLFTSYPVFLLSGYSWPEQCLPSFLRFFADILPSTPFFKAYTGLTRMECGMRDVSTYVTEMVILASIGLFLLILRLAYLRKTEARREINTKLAN